MTAQPDPQLVREIARGLIEDNGRRTRGVVTGIHDRVTWELGEEARQDDDYVEAVCAAVDTAIESATIPAAWPDDRTFAWHELRVLSTPSLADDDVDHYEVGHAAECAALPPGAVCWAVREPFRWWWPAIGGTYRIRPEDVPLGGDEDGPDWDVTLHVQVQDEAGDWTDYDGDTAGSEPTSGEYGAIVERIKAATAEKMARQDAEQNARDDDVTSVRDALIALDVLRIDLPAPAARRMAKLHTRFADRIADLDARASDGTS